MKVCKQCKQEKELKEFYRHPNFSDGYNSKCKACMKNKKDVSIVRSGMNLFNTTDGNGGAYWFDMGKLLSIDRQLLVDNNIVCDKNIKKFHNRRLFNTNKQRLIDVALLIDMNPNAVYLLERETKNKDKEKYCLNLFFPKGMVYHAKN